ncbi:MAG: DUF3050 domain-containing protein [Reyranella sp.]|nr:DUF3050 domain-containing protein [Reyranella sp.]
MSAIGMYKLLRRLEPARAQLAAHGVYQSLETIEDVRIFMEHHVFAVWDFMSLLKVLQGHLTCTTVPWVPVGSPRLRRVINEVVLGEESDEVDGRPTSHFELYHHAMKAIGAQTRAIDRLIADVRDGASIEVALHECGAPVGSSAFVQNTFEIIASGKLHMIAAAFAFGREEPIPNMFRTLVAALARQNSEKVQSLVSYLDRHIGLDEDHHAPMVVEMLAELCGDDPVRWDEAAQAAIASLSARLTLWSVVVSEVSLTRMGISRRRAA